MLHFKIAPSYSSRAEGVYMYVNTQIVLLPMFILYLYIVIYSVPIGVANVSYTGVYPKRLLIRIAQIHTSISVPTPSTY